MCFGPDPGVTSRIQWYWADEGALDLGFPTPFHSRVQDMHEVIPPIGEVTWEKREWRDGTFPIKVSGKCPPIGTLSEWQNGWDVAAGTGLPRNMFGLAEACGGLQAFPGQPVMGIRSGLAPWFPDLVSKRFVSVDSKVKPFNRLRWAFPGNASSIIELPFKLLRQPIVSGNESNYNRLLNCLDDIDNHVPAIVKSFNLPELKESKIDRNAVLANSASIASVYVASLNRQVLDKPAATLISRTMPVSIFQESYLIVERTPSQPSQMPVEERINYKETASPSLKSILESTWIPGITTKASNVYNAAIASQTTSPRSLPISVASTPPTIGNLGTAPYQFSIKNLIFTWVTPTTAGSDLVATFCVSNTVTVSMPAGWVAVSNWAVNASLKAYQYIYPSAPVTNTFTVTTNLATIGLGFAPEIKNLVNHAIDVSTLVNTGTSASAATLATGALAGTLDVLLAHVFTATTGINPTGFSNGYTPNGVLGGVGLSGIAGYLIPASSASSSTTCSLTASCPWASHLSAFK